MNIMNELKKAEKEFEIEGVMVAFRRKSDGFDCTRTMVKDLGVVLRLLEEAKIHRMRINKTNEEIAFTESEQIKSKNKLKSSMFG